MARVVRRLRFGQSRGGTPRALRHHAVALHANPHISSRTIGVTDERRAIHGTRHTIDSCSAQAKTKLPDFPAGVVISGAIRHLMTVESPLERVDE
jgi:hypothetical protein